MGNVLVKEIVCQIECLAHLGAVGGLVPVPPRRRPNHLSFLVLTFPPLFSLSLPCGIHMVLEKTEQ